MTTTATFDQAWAAFKESDTVTICRLINEHGYQAARELVPGEISEEQFESAIELMACLLHLMDYQKYLELRRSTN